MAVSSTSGGVAESDGVTSQTYLEFVEVILAVALPVRLTRRPCTTLKAEHSIFVLVFNISCIATVYVCPSIINWDAIQRRDFISSG